MYMYIDHLIVDGRAIYRYAHDRFKGTFEVVPWYSCTPLLYSCNSYSPLGTDSIGYSCSRYTQITEQTAQTHHNVLSVSLNKLSLRLIGAMHRVHNAMRRNLDCEQHL